MTPGPGCGFRSNSESYIVAQPAFIKNAPITAQIKNPLARAERVANWLPGEALGTHYVGRLKTLGAFQQVELDGFAFIQ